MNSSESGIFYNDIIGFHNNKRIKKLTKESNNFRKKALIYRVKKKALGAMEGLFSIEYLKGITRKSQSRIIRAVGLYRYLSLLLTSLVFLFIGSSALDERKIIIVLILSIEAELIMKIYSKFGKNLKVIKATIMLETILSALLIYPTGGVYSPFIWYSLNPIICGSVLTKGKFGWVNLTIYTILLPTQVYAYHDSHSEIYSILCTNITLLFILITLGVQQLSKYATEVQGKSRELKEKNTKLLELNRKLAVAHNATNNCNENMMMLYKIVEHFNSKDDEESIPLVFSSYAKRLMDSETAFFWMKQGLKENQLVLNEDREEDNLRLDILREIESCYGKYQELESIFSMKIHNDTYLVSLIKSNHKVYGAIGVKVEALNVKNRFYKNQLTFLTDLSSMILERIHLQQVSQRLTITEEQNRIASEIHDSVSQQLFSIVCGLHSMVKHLGDISTKDLVKQLNLIKETANTSLSDLRQTIYSLSSKKKKQKSFYLEIKEQLSCMGSLNKVQIDLTMDGDEGLIPCDIKKAIYRIICEGAGNAIRHGKCTYLNVSMEVEDEKIKANIFDNGVGFDIEKVMKDKNTGLGVYNMKTLSKHYNGKCTIRSEVNNGTTIRVEIPITNTLPNVLSKVGEMIVS